ncbi:MAG: LicD family protein [Erysipelotrichaceae bacterium]|nr:LicD family protein [Erysipelotrichaceae bacterium]
MNQINEDNQLRKLQLLELEALTEFRQFCKKNNMDFILRGGSVMGAVKYKGFVPWDDDADVAIPRPDYDRLIEIANQDWSEKFYLLSYKQDPEIHCYFPRILVKENVRKELGLPTNNKLGLTVIDVFPLDGTPNSIIKRNFYYLHTYIYRAIAGVWTMDVKGTVNMHNSKQRFLLKVLKILGVNKLFTQVELYDKLDILYHKYPLENSNYIGTMTGSLYKKEIVKKSWYGNCIEMQFENQTFLIPENYDEYLKQYYGDNYMEYTPNPKEINARTHVKKGD